MSPLRFLPPLLFLAAVQVGLWLSVCAIFLPRPGQARGRRLLALAQVVVAVVFFGFVTLARQGLEPPALLRALLIEPMLAAEALSFPLMLCLAIAVTIARRLPSRTAGKGAALPGVALASPDVPRAEAARVPGPPPLPEPRRVLLARAATGLFALTGAAAVFGIEQAELAPELSRHDLFIRGLHPDLDGVTIVQLSDIHAGALMTEERMRRIASAAAALQPDLVVLTGDLIDVSPRAARPFSRAFEGLHGKLGSFAVLGNHDYFAGAAEVERAVRDAGLTLLRNSGARIERGRGTLYLGGVDDPSRGGLGPDPARALRAAAPEEPRVMLAHRPSLFPDCARAGAQLVLSGHTHGGQVALSPAWSLARLLGPYTMGHFQEGGAQLYVHRGMGTVGPAPLRLGSPPELALLTLRRS